MRVEPPIDSRLGDAVGQLAVAQVVIRRDTDFLRAGDPGIGRILPVDVELPCVDGFGFENPIQLRSAGCHHDVRRARRRKRCPVDVGVVQEVDVLDDEALFGRRFAFQHPRAIDDAGVLLGGNGVGNPVVAGARRDVVPVGPD